MERRRDEEVKTSVLVVDEQTAGFVGRLFPPFIGNNCQRVSPSYGYLNRSMMASTRLCNNLSHLISLRVASRGPGAALWAGGGPIATAVEEL